MSLVSQYAADWMVSWLMHATVASILALAAGRWLVADPRLRDLLWKTALLLPLGTSLVSLSMSPVSSRSMDLAVLARPHLPSAFRSERVSVQMTSAATSGAIDIQDGAQRLRYLVLAILLVPAAVATNGLVQRRRRFRTSLRSRRPTDARELGIDPRALSLGQRTARISVSSQVGSAAAVASGEICVSSEFSELGRTEQHAVLAHEMAHLARRDLAWITLADAVACVLAAQPLVRLIVRQFRRDAEFICDDVAIRGTGNATAYVRALLLFAKNDVAVPVLAYGSSPIVQRAERVLNLQTRDRPPTPRLLAPIVVVMLLASLLSLPHVRVGAANHRVRTEVSTQRAAGSTQIKVTLKSR